MLNSVDNSIVKRLISFISSNSTNSAVIRLLLLLFQRIITLSSIENKQLLQLD